VEKRQRILFQRNSRHSLDDEPLPVEEPEVVINVESSELDWNSVLDDEETKEEVYHEEEEEEEEEDDDEDEDEDDDPRTLILHDSANSRQFSSLSDEISEWALVRERRDRLAKSKEHLHRAIERLFDAPKQSISASTTPTSTNQSSSIEMVDAALEKIKRGLLDAIVNVMNSSSSSGSTAKPASVVVGNAFAQLHPAADQGK